MVTYDGAVKLIDSLIKKYSSKELVHKFGKAPTSTFSLTMIAWDMQGLSDGVGDFMYCWGDVSLTAAISPRAASIPMGDVT